MTSSTLGLISTIGLGLGFVIAVSSFLAAVQERRREFGIMSSIGLADEVLYFFLVESAIVFVAAYLVGVLGAGVAVALVIPGIATPTAWLQAAGMVAAFLPAMAIVGRSSRCTGCCNNDPSIAAGGPLMIRRRVCPTGGCRRAAGSREMVLPVVTTATGAFLVVIVFGMSDGIRAQSASLGHADEIGRPCVLIAVTVLLVGVVEVAVATTRTVAHRTRELGVLGANGVPRKPGGRGPARRTGDRRGTGCGRSAPRWPALTGIVLGGSRVWSPPACRTAGLALGAAIAVGVSIVAALATSIVPTWNAASRPPIRSLTAGG